MSKGMSDQELNLEARLEAHALLDRLTRDGHDIRPRGCPALDRADPGHAAAALLVHRPVPGPRAWPSRAGCRCRRCGAGRRGQGEAGVLERPTGSPDRRLPGYSCARAGCDRTHVDRDPARTCPGRSCQLLYEAETGEPRAMEISIQRTLTLLFIRLAYITYASWKTPEG